MKLNGLFFAIGHDRATEFLEEQLELELDGYVVPKPGSTATSVKSVFSTDGVQDNKYRLTILNVIHFCMLTYHLCGKLEGEVE